MKKILFFLMLLFCVPFSIFGITGNGSFGSPYSGPLTTNMTWSGTVYVNGDITVNGFTLTISPGAIIVFLATGSDIIITGTGILTASGSAASVIRFTADFNNNGIYGETGERWGHISFQNMNVGFTGTSLINYCIVEFGQKGSDVFNFETSGGGIQTAYSFLTISNSIIRNNYAGWGGGIYVNANCSPNIINCFIYNNIAGTTGGGLSIYQHSSAIIENCVIEKNTCNGGGSGGGVFVGDYPDNVKFYNCTIVSNSSTSGGINIRIWKSAPSNGPQFINTIVWGSPNSINYLQLGPNATDFNYSAIQGYTTGYTNCINLSSNNTDPIGPNFVDPTISNYSITFASPCRDAGTTPSPAIPTDILGNPRLGPYDIGAYELQYPQWVWTGATNGDWATSTNWTTNTVPSASSDVIIVPSAHNPIITISDVTVNSLAIGLNSALTVSNYLTLTSPTVTNSGTLTVTMGSSFNVGSFINTGTFVIQPTARTTATTLTNNGTINLNSTVTDMFSLMFDSYTGTGTSNIAMALSGGGGDNHWAWHYVAVPVFYNKDKTVFTSISPLDLMNYNDSYIPNTLTATDNDGWVWHDGYRAGPPPDLLGPSFSSLYTGVGYAFYHSTNSTVNFTNVTSLMPNIGSLGLQYSGTGKLVPSNYGWNLLGNSLTCGINWNLITTTGGVFNTVYYTINYKIGAYVRNAPGGINGATEHIPPLQGFLVRATASGATIDLTNAREHTTQQRYKKSLDVNNIDSKNSGSSDPIIKLELDNPGNQDETLIWFSQNATTSFDPDYDGLKILSSGYDQIYSWSGTYKFGINAMPLPTDPVIIPVAVKFLTGGSAIKIVASQLVGLDNYAVTLTDKGNSDFTVDLKSTNNYTFSSDAGTFPDRFVLTVGAISTGVSDVIATNKDFNVYAYANTLNIELLNPEWNGKNNTINLYDLTGRKIIQQTNVELVKGELKTIPLNLSQGIYIVEIKSETQKFVTKINIVR